MCVLWRSDLETLLLPLLQMLYSAAGRAPSHLYMLLIILLILTQDASFAANVHKVPPSLPTQGSCGTWRPLATSFLDASRPSAGCRDLNSQGWCLLLDRICRRQQGTAAVYFGAMRPGS